jgi:septum formation protein
MIYLASQSPRRKTLLRQLGLQFKVIKPNVEESVTGRDPKTVAVRLAEAKVLSAAPRVRRGVILGVDTIVVLGRRIMGKPASKADARRMLQALSGRTHRVICGLCLLRKPGGRKLLGAEVTKVRFRKLTPSEIEDYVSTREPCDKAGAYAIQGRAGLFVDRIEGNYFNIVGLPVPRLLELLSRI